MFHTAKVSLSVQSYYVKEVSLQDGIVKTVKSRVSLTVKHLNYRKFKKILYMDLK